MSSHSPGIEEMKREVPPGRCIICERQIRPPKRVLCHRADCRTAYDQVYAIDRRAKLPRKRKASR